MFVPKTLPCALVAATLAGCAAGTEATESEVLEGDEISGLIKFENMYSAWDGIHNYRVTPSIPLAAPDSTSSDALDPTSVRWVIDSAFVSLAEYPALPGGALLTTRKAGNTVVRATAMTLDGRKVKGSAPLQISAATDAAWELGSARYSNELAINWSQTLSGGADGADRFTCNGVTLAFSVPKTASCANCHDDMGALGIEHTPQQTAGYSDGDLLAIFTEGMKPMGGKFVSPLLAGIPDPEFQACFYRAFHAWDIEDSVKQGIVFKLRSITPKTQAAIDYARLAAAVQTSSTPEPGADPGP